jgi:hypothetical protein
MPAGAGGAAPAGAGRWLVASDLDLTLIFSRHWFRLPAGAAEQPVVAVESFQGEPASFMTEEAFAGLAELRRWAELVPVTTRTLGQYSRIDLGGRPRFAVAANGGHLLVDGVPDPGWAAMVAARLRGCAPLEEVRAVAERFAGDWTRLVRVADQLFVYLVAHERDGIPDLAEVTARAEAVGWTVSLQGRKIYFVPAPLTKQAALAEVAVRAGAEKIVAAGDSLLDAPMLLAADVALRPAHGELHDRSWTAPHLRVTACDGLLGGEEIVASFLTLVSPADQGGRWRRSTSGSASW